MLKRITPYPLRTRIKGLAYDFWFYQIPKVRYNFQHFIGQKLTMVSLVNIKHRAHGQKIKVFYVVPCLHFGGAEVMLWQLLRHIDRTKFEICIICTHERGVLADQLEPLVDKLHDLSATNKTNWQKNKEILRIIDQHNIDIIHFSNSEALFFLSCTLKLERPEIRIMNWVHCDILFFERLYHYAYKRFGQVIDHTVVVNKNMRDYLINKKGISPNKVTTIINGIDPEKFSITKYDKRTVLKKLGIGNNKTVISFITRLSSEKNPIKFIEIASQLIKSVPDSQFIIAGDGYLRKKVEREIAKRSLEKNFLLLGFIDNVAEVLTVSDILISCSLTEGLPLNILEAMSMGVPVIAHPVGGIKEVIQNGYNGYLVENNDPGHYVKIIKEIIKNKEIKSRIGNNAVQTIKKNYDIKTTVQKMIRVYTNSMTIEPTRFH